MKFPRLRLTVGLLLAWFTANGSVAAERSSAGAGTVAEVRVDRQETVVKSFFGLGIQWDPYEYPPRPAAWQLTRHRLDFAKPAFFRVMFSGNAYCRGFDGAGQPRYVWTESEAEMRRRMGSLLAILDYAQTNQIDVMLGEWGPPGKLGEGEHDTITAPDDPRWARLVTDAVHWLRTQRGYSVVRWYNLMNEPNGSWMWPGGKVDYNAWAAGIRGLRRSFDAQGLAGVAIVGPDNSGDWDWADRVSQELPEAIGAWEMHWYARDQEVLDGAIETLLRAKKKIILAHDPGARDKRFYMGESGLIDGRCNGDQQPRVRTFLYGVMMADYAAQVAGAGWMGLSAWDMDDAMHPANGHPAVPVDTTLKRWGFWNTQGTAMGHPEDENIRPWFYPWSLMSRLFPRDTRILPVAPTGRANLRIMAGETPQRGHFNFMVVNNADAVRSVRLVIPGGGRSTVQLYHYFERDHPSDVDGFAVPSLSLPVTDLGGGVRVDLPGRGCVFVATVPAS